MKHTSKHSLLHLGTAVLLGGFSLLPARAAVLFDYNFNSLSNGALNGQNNWSTLTGRLSPNVAAGPGGSINTTQTVTNASTDTAPSLIENSSLFTAGTIVANDTITLTFDVYADTTGSILYFGIGGPTYGGGANPGVQFGLFGGVWQVRDQNLGTQTAALNGGGFAITPNADQWYSVQSVWDLSTNTATLAVKNLTLGEASYTTLYFNAAQTVSTVTMNFADFAAWNTAYLRVSHSTNGIGYLDNLHVDVVPEPSAWMLLTGSAMVLTVFRRRGTRA